MNAEIQKNIDLDKINKVFNCLTYTNIKLELINKKAVFNLIAPPSGGIIEEVIAQAGSSR